MEPVQKPDTTNTDPKYWEEILKSHGLSMRRGERPWLVYVGGSKELEAVEEQQYARETGRKTPQGRGPTT